MPKASKSGVKKKGKEKEPVAHPEPAVRALVRWFPRAARDLPWRHTLDPYAIWVSEIMLQQTQVNTVIPYWERWMRLFPTPAKLAAADESTVLKAWEGLGYYSRARNLQAAARRLHSGSPACFPETAAEWMELPGVGPYTAGAITSIAKNLPEPILDGNVIRVLTRVHALPGNPASGPLKQQLWQWARAWVSAAQGLRAETSPPLVFAGSCSILNQALMELGATLCTPRSPGCPDCPVRDQCQAFRLGKPEAFPELPERAAVTVVRRVVVLLELAGAVAIRQRPTGGINGGLWEFPELDRPTQHEPAGALAETWSRIPSDRFESLPGVSHSITRYRIHLEVVRAKLQRRPNRVPSSAQARLHWIRLGELGDLPFTAAHRKIAARTYPPARA